MGDRALEEASPLTIRAFFGVPLPQAQREQLGEFLSRCQVLAPEFRWSVAENLHLTVRFIGSIERALVEGIADRLQGAAGPPIELALGDSGTFKRSRLARVVWVGLKSGGAGMTALAARVEAECRAAGLPPEVRPFQPHMTLARARSRDGARAPDLPALPPLDPWTASELILYWSHLKKNGAVHEPIRAIRLAA